MLRGTEVPEVLLQIFLEAMGGKIDRPNPVFSFPMGICLARSITEGMNVYEENPARISVQILSRALSELVLIFLLKNLRQ